jgi:hypothetical protein
MMLDRWLKCRNWIMLFQMAMHRHVFEISRIMHKSRLSHFLINHTDTDDVILVYILVILRHQAEVMWGHLIFSLITHSLGITHHGGFHTYIGS